MGRRLLETIKRVLPRVLLLGIVNAAAAQDDTATRHALLIGINEYVSSDVPDLQGAVNDVTMLRRILMTRFGFEDRNVTVLTDEDATRAAILDAFDRLADDIAPDDFVYIHFSGHGSQIQDLNGDEEDDGLDETILSHDAREDGVPDIIDDEFESAFARLPTEHAFIVFDSCHSGTISRAPALVRPRFVKPDERIELYRRFASRTREIVLVKELGHVLMAGAPPDEQALDGPVDGGWYGLFSYALARGLDSLGPSATPIDLHAATKQELRRIQEQLYTTPPEPQLEAPEQRLREPIVWSGRAVAVVPDNPTRRSWLDVERMSGGLLRMLDGAALNARPGSQWGIYGSEETRFEYGNALALGIVQEMDGRDAILALQVESAPIPAGARAIALAPPEVSDYVPVRIDAPSARRSRLAQAIETRLATVQFVGERDFARFIVALDGDTWQVMDAGGLNTALSFTGVDDEHLAEQLAQLFSSSATATTLLALDNPATDIQLWFDVVKRAPDGIVQSYRIRSSGEPRSEENSLMLELRSDRDVYVTVVDIDTEGRVSLLFPNDYQNRSFLPDGFIPANTPVRIPDSLANANRAGFHWDYSPPVGKDNIRVFATTDLAVAEIIRKLVGQTRDTRGAFGSLRSALLNTAIRGVQVVPDIPGGDIVEPATEGPSDWSAASIVIEVHE